MSPLIPAVSEGAERTLSQDATNSREESGENARQDTPSAGGCSDVSAVSVVLLDFANEPGERKMTHLLT